MYASGRSESSQLRLDKTQTVHYIKTFMYTPTLSAKFSASKQKHPLRSLWIGLLLTTLPYEPIQQSTALNPSI